MTKSSADILDTSTPEKAAAKPEVGGFVLFCLIFFLARRFRLLLACGVKVTAFLFEAYANELWCSKADGCARDRAQATDLELSACVSSTTLFPSPTQPLVSPNGTVIASVTNDVRSLTVSRP